MQPSKYQLAVYEAFKETKDNLNISAVAGSGKTTVLLELLKLVPENKSALFLAFNNSIVDELRERAEIRPGVEITTIHSYGWRAIMSRYGCKAKMNPNKSMGKVEKLFKKFTQINAKKHGWYFYIVPKMLDLMRCNLCEPDKESIQQLADYYDLLIGDTEIEFTQEAFKLMNKDKSQFDFMDMIYQPCVDSSVRLGKYEYVFCDESQDVSAAQQEVIRKALNRRGRLITVGDERQAIYGFAGADADSYQNLGHINGDATHMPLSICYRCAKSIVREAQRIVPEIEYNPNQVEGVVRNGTLIDMEHGDWVLCRNLKPLVQTYLWLMKNKIKSKIRGKDIGEGMISLICKTGAKTLHGLVVLLDVEKKKLYKKLVKKGVNHPSLHPKMEVLCQKIEVIEYLANEVNSVKELKELIENIFTDDVKGILLSTIHKAKGLENNRIFFLAPELIPSKFATQPWQIEQEMNLRYVAITRAKVELIYVPGWQFKQDLECKIVI